MKAITKSSVDCDDTSRESDTLICGFGPRRRGGDANSISSDNFYGTEVGVDMNMGENGGGLNSSLICGFGGVGGDGNSHGSGSTIGRGEQVTSSSVMVTTANIPSSAYSSTSISIPTKTEEGSATRGIPRMDSSKSISSEGDMSMASEDAVVLMINMLEEAGDIGGDHHHGNNKDHNEKYFADEEVCGRVFKRQSITDYESIPTELEIESGALDQQSSWSTSLPNNNHNSDNKKLIVNNENKVEKLNSHSEGLYTKSIIPQTTPELQPASDTRSGPSSQPQKQCLKQTTSLTKNVSINNHATYIAENGESNVATKGRNNIRTNKPTVSFQSISSSSNNNNHMTCPSAVGSSEVDQNLDVIEEDESSDSSTVASDLKYSMLSEAATDVSSRVSSDASSGSDPYFSSTNLIPIGEHAKSMARQLKMNPSHGGGSTKRVRE